MSKKDQKDKSNSDPFADIQLMEIDGINFGEWESFGFEDSPTNQTEPNTKDTKKD